jgi:hypothetical protein
MRNSTFANSDRRIFQIAFIGDSRSRAVFKIVAQDIMKRRVVDDKEHHDVRALARLWFLPEHTANHHPPPFTFQLNFTAQFTPKDSSQVVDVDARLYWSPFFDNITNSVDRIMMSNAPAPDIVLFQSNVCATKRLFSQSSHMNHFTPT